jgi:alpha-galactosidase
LGVEWDLALATEREIAELMAWIAFYKEQRGFLLSGDLVRMDGMGDGVHLHGVVASDRSRALFAFAPADSLYPDPAPRLRFRGLDPEQAYRVRPVLIGARPSGLKPPRWWGAPDFPGVVLTGAALERAGVAAPILHPDQVALLRMDAVRHSV